MTKPKTKPKPNPKQPSWLVHFHYGPKSIPLTVYDNHDGSFAFYDNDKLHKRVDAEKALRLLAGKMNELALGRTKLHG